VDDGARYTHHPKIPRYKGVGNPPISTAKAPASLFPETLLATAEEVIQ